VKAAVGDPMHESLQSAASAVDEHVGQPVRAAAHAGVSAASEVGGQVSEGVQQAGHDVKSAAESAATTVKAALPDPIHENLQSAASAVDEHVGQPIREAAEHAEHGVKSAAESASSVVHAGVEEAMHQAEPVATKVAEKIEAPDPFDTAVDAASMAASQAQESLDDHLEARNKRLPKTQPPSPPRAKTPSVDPDHVSMNKLFGEKKQKTASVGPEHEPMESLFREHPGFDAAQPTEEHNFQKALDPIANSGTRKGLGWFRKMKSAAGRASKSIRSGVASLKQRLGFGNGPVDRHDEVPRVGELPKKFDDGMNPSWHHPTRR
jgi:hypothetical protein